MIGQGLPVAVDGVGPDFYCAFSPYYDDNGVPDYEFEPVVLHANLSSNDGSAVSCDNMPTSFQGNVSATSNYRVTLSLTYDLQEIQWNKTLEYYLAPSVDAIRPWRVTQA